MCSVLHSNYENNLRTLIILTHLHPTLPTFPAALASWVTGCGWLSGRLWVAGWPALAGCAALAVGCAAAAAPLDIGCGTGRHGWLRLESRPQRGFLAGGDFEG